VLAVLVVLPATELARRLYPELQTTELLMSVLLLLPLPFLYLSLPMRDTLNLVVFFSILAALARGYHLEQPWLVLLAIPLVGILSLLRPELGFILSLSVFVAIVVMIIQAISTQ
jgi:hypothetical protein